MSIRYTTQHTDLGSPQATYAGPRGHGWQYTAHTSSGESRVTATLTGNPTWVLLTRSVISATAIAAALNERRIDPHAFDWEQQ